MRRLVRLAAVAMIAVLVLGMGAVPALACGDTQCPPCEGVRSPGYWKNHPEAWPVSFIEIGGISYSKEDAIARMGEEGEDKTNTLFRALVAAKLDLMMGCDGCQILQTVWDADWWMHVNPGPVAGSDANWRCGEEYYLRLDAYVNGFMNVPAAD